MQEELTLQKKKLRALMRERLESLLPDERAAERARDLFLQHFLLPKGAMVAGTLPIRHEMDPRPLMEALSAMGHPLCLPVMQGRGQPLLFRAFRIGDPMEIKVWGLREPLPGAPLVRPDVLICPLVAFDRKGRRLGYGAGYYDATLRFLRDEGRVLAVGLAHAAQEVPLAPASDSDQTLDAVVTEAEVIKP